MVECEYAYDDEGSSTRVRIRRGRPADQDPDAGPGEATAPGPDGPAGATAQTSLLGEASSVLGDVADRDVRLLLDRRVDRQSRGPGATPCRHDADPAAPWSDRSLRRGSGSPACGDPALTELGGVAGREGRRRLAEAKLDAIVSSPLGRARQTGRGRGQGDRPARPRRRGPARDRLRRLGRPHLRRDPGTLAPRDERVAGRPSGGLPGGESFQSGRTPASSGRGAHPGRASGETVLVVST